MQAKFCAVNHHESQAIKWTNRNRALAICARFAYLYFARSGDVELLPTSHSYMRTLAAEPLFYLPSENFFILAASADVFVVADDIQFSTSGSFNRAQIKTVAGATWLTIPVLSKGRGRQRLDTVEIDNNRPWQRQHWRSIEFNYHNAPYFGEMGEALAPLYQHPYRNLANAAWDFLLLLWNTLGFEKSPSRTSELGVKGTGEKRLVALAAKMNADIYLAQEKYRAALRPERLQGIQLRLVNLGLPPYHQQYSMFIPGLNILDLLFNEGIAFARERVRKLAAAARNA